MAQAGKYSNNTSLHWAPTCDKGKNNGSQLLVFRQIIKSGWKDPHSLIQQQHRIDSPGSKCIFLLSLRSMCTLPRHQQTSMSRGCSGRRAYGCLVLLQLISVVSGFTSSRSAGLCLATVILNCCCCRLHKVSRRLLKKTSDPDYCWICRCLL